MPISDLVGAQIDVVKQASGKNPEVRLVSRNWRRLFTHHVSRPSSLSVGLERTSIYARCLKKITHIFRSASQPKRESNVPDMRDLLTW